MSEQDKQCREAFEAWALDEGFTVRRAPEDTETCVYCMDYLDADTETAWRGYQAAYSRRTPQAQLTDDHIRDATKLILTESEIDLLHDKHMFEAMDGYCMLDYQGFAKAIAARCGDKQTKEKAEMFDWLILQDIENNFPRSGVFVGKIPDNLALTHDNAIAAIK